ncbi:FecR domain-containing protein [Chryseolinea lacunae]|nr:FecR domain-containing protein [Chryseolinea lacunae]
MKYTNFSVNDFVTDDYFHYWVAHPGDHSAHVFWEAWLKQHPEKREDVEEARAILESIRFSNHTLSTEDLAQLWDRVRHIDTAREQGRSLMAPAYRWYGVAAAVITLLMVTAVYFMTGTKPWKEYTTAYGETKTVVLPDNSKVILNANSSLRILNNWTEKPEREIWLEGEAFFSVVHTKDHKPFKVMTSDGVSVEVLGTTFNVYKRTLKTTVILNSGQIRLNLPLEKTREKILMKPGDMVEFKGSKYKKEEVDPRLYTAWTQNKIMLNHTSLGEMVRMLTDNYGLDVKVTDTTLLEQTVSGSMPLGDDDVLLQQMAKAFQLKITRNGQTISIEE